MIQFPSERVISSIHFFLDGCNGSCGQEESQQTRNIVLQHSKDIIPSQLHLEQSHARVRALLQGSTDLTLQKTQDATTFVDNMAKLDTEQHTVNHSTELGSFLPSLSSQVTLDATKFIDNMEKLDGRHTDHQESKKHIEGSILPSLSSQTTLDASKFIDNMEKLTKFGNGKEHTVNQGTPKHGTRTLEDQLPNLSLQKAHAATKFVDNMERLDSPKVTRRTINPSQSETLEQLPNLSLQKTRDASKFIDNMEKLDNGQDVAKHFNGSSLAHSHHRPSGTNLTLQKTRDASRFINNIQHQLEA